MQPPPHFLPIICPPFPYGDFVYRHMPKGYALGAQDCSPYKEGAYTGSVSAAMLRDIGCQYVLLGHSECRVDHAVLLEKIERVLEVGMMPLVCVGEDKASFWKQEIMPQLALPQEVHCVAYEPRWAIGGTVLPEAKHLQEVFSVLQKHAVLYGGGIDQNTIGLLLEAVPQLAGILVGRAGRDSASWNALLECVASVRG